MDPSYLGGFGPLGFPLWVRVTHWFNFLFLTLLARSGLAILAAHPKLYWNIHSRPGSEWIRFTRKALPADRMWCSTDEEVEAPSWLALPGGKGLGLGRYWHFFNAMAWPLCGLVYVTLMFATPQWRRLVPTSWEVLPDAWRTLVAYLQFQQPGPHPPYSYDPRLPFNSLQQLTYFGLIFGLVPFEIATGLAQSPSILGRLPWVERAFGRGGRQAARSIHFLGLAAFAGFLVVHVFMVAWHGFAAEMDKMVLGREEATGSWLGAWLGLGIVAAVVAIHAAANHASARHRRATHRALAAVVDPVRRNTLHRLVSVQDYRESEVSPYFRLNGYPPIAAYPQAQGGDQTYERLLGGGFADYRLEVGGLVKCPLSLSLDDLRAMARQDQTTLHHCIQGWTSIGRWSGVPIGEVLDRCRPSPEARYLVFRSFGMHEYTGKPYYKCVAMEIGRHPQAILAYELNGERLPLQHGAPLRARFETKLGFKMVKFLRSIEVVDDYRRVGDGLGGSREDEQQFDMGAEI
ncbi:Sulfoxide reductase catalytic subunit YedY precursor [Aquisphaera giovannonii]|uniref:Sulfoxide reductase catalytic subunit YedY n=1 Tax=Aquisphaera giovannonii TaxID=406548 RepID=A0A5B9W3G5_9BACT|nr:molybdopterin-dependent oxidoreductase [Aquisphaera giovannonii]QEH34789.1 Sulfoxide reductase catalytic subunit YedY precursor [Aquisphaera giovannonii]